MRSGGVWAGGAAGRPSEQISRSRKARAVTVANARQSNERSDGDTPSRAGVVLNWTLVLLAVPGAAAVVILQYVEILGTAACSDGSCPHLGPGPVGFVLVQYGAPAVAVVAVALSFFTARRRRGILVPVCAWVLLAIAAAVVILSFRN
jgi:hypothetical protein